VAQQWAILLVHNGNWSLSSCCLTEAALTFNKSKSSPDGIGNEPIRSMTNESTAMGPAASKSQPSTTTSYQALEYLVGCEARPQKD
jgi:hypothetical protein